MIDLIKVFLLFYIIIVSFITGHIIHKYNTSKEVAAILIGWSGIIWASLMIYLF